MARVTVRWVELAGYSRATGKFEAEHPLGASSVANVKAATQAGPPLNARTRLEPLKPGAYRVTLEGETASGQTARIDQRDFWFDGKTFEEL